MAPAPTFTSVMSGSAHCYPEHNDKCSVVPLQLDQHIALKYRYQLNVSIAVFVNVWCPCHLSLCSFEDVGIVNSIVKEGGLEPCSICGVVSAI